MEVIKYRRSIRDYEDKPVEKEKVEKILRAAMQAPSAYNQQPWEFIVVTDKKILSEMAEMSEHSKMLNEAQVAIVVLADKKNMKLPEYWQQDLGAATENILLEISHLGLGGLWLAVAPEEDRIAYIKKFFNLPEGIEPYCVIPMGYPKQEPKFIDRYDSNKVHYEKW